MGDRKVAINIKSEVFSPNPFVMSLAASFAHARRYDDYFLTQNATLTTLTFLS